MKGMDIVNSINKANEIDNMFRSDIKCCTTCFWRTVLSKNICKRCVDKSEYEKAKNPYSYMG